MIFEVVGVLNVKGSKPRLVRGVKEKDKYQYNIVGGGYGSYKVCDIMPTLLLSVKTPEGIITLDIKEQIKSYFEISILGTEEKNRAIQSAPSKIELLVNLVRNRYYISDSSLNAWNERYKAIS